MKTLHRWAPHLLITLIILSTAYSTAFGASPNALVQQIQDLFAQSQYPVLIAKAKEFVKAYPGHPSRGQVENLHGLALLLTQKPAEAIPHFERAMADARQIQHRPYIQYNLATAYLDAKRTEDALKVAYEVTPENLDRDARTKLFLLRAQARAQHQEPVEAAREYLNASFLLEGTDAEASTRKSLQTALENAQDIDALETVYTAQMTAPFIDAVLYRLAELQARENKTDPAKKNLLGLIDRFPRSSYVTQARALLSQLNTTPTSTPTPDANKLEPTKIGLLLPLRGRFERFGQNALQAAQLAFGIFDKTAPEGGKFQLVVENAGETPEQTVSALDRLVAKHGVIAVIGPLMSKGIEQVAARAAQLEVLLIPLAQTPVDGNAWVVNAGLTPKVQSDQIAEFATKKLGLKKFAILHPRDKFGHLYSQNYWDSAEANGGKIVAIESYAPGETDFRQAVDKISGLFYTEAREEELQALAEQRKQLEITKRTRKTEQYYRLPPIVDYEAVFIPDEPKVLGQILPTFAYRDVDQVKFLGISTWNTPELGTRAQDISDRAYFVDVFAKNADSATARKFSENYRQTFGQDPSSIEALSYDAAAICRFILQDSRPSSRSSFKSAITSVKNFAGSTGRLTYQNGSLQRELLVFGLKAGQIVPIH